MPSAYSYSTIQAFRECPQKDYYARVQHLTPRARMPRLELGTLIHTYLEVFYENIRHPDPHTMGLEALRGQEGYVQGLARTAAALDLLDTAHELAELVEKAETIVDRYYVVRGRADQELQMEVFLVEERVDVPLYPGVTLRTKIDLVTCEDGEYVLWENKTGQNEPRLDARLRDLQVCVYSAALGLIGIEVGRVRWNYLRTKLPTVPQMLQRGGLSKAMSIDTTAWQYQKAIEENALDASDYVGILAALEGREERVFYPRIDLPLLGQESILLGDLIMTARQMEYEGKGGVRPRHHVGMHCDWCEYRRLCSARLLDGNYDHILATEFVRRGERSSNDDTHLINPESDFEAIA